MFGTTSYANRAAAYAKVETVTSVEAATPHQLILMLYDGALLSLRTAKISMEQMDIPKKGASISKAIDIITNGLKVSLDLNSGGDLAGRLDSLYEYMTDRLLYANLHNNVAALDEVADLLQGLRDAWATIGSQTS